VARTDEQTAAAPAPTVGARRRGRHEPGGTLVRGARAGTRRGPAINPATGAHVADQGEYDFDVTYTFQSGWVKGLQIKTRAALVDFEGTPGLLPDVRLILNWPLPLF